LVIDKAFFEGIAALSLKKITQYSAKRSYAKSGSYFLIITKVGNLSSRRDVLIGAL